jgi:DNA-binding NtrC family response regulator
MANIVLTGLEFYIQAELTRVLDRLGHQVFISRNSIPSTADVVFCNGDVENGPAMLRAIRAVRPELPVVVVTRQPDVGKWLDALDAGAADYCSAPFETIQVRWLLDAVLGHGAAGGNTEHTAITVG